MGQCCQKSRRPLISYRRETRCTRCSSSRVAVISLPMRSKLPIKVENSSKKNSSCSFPSLQSRILSVTCHSERFQSHLSTSDLSRQQHFQRESVSARRKFQEPLQELFLYRKWFETRFTSHHWCFLSHPK